MDHQGREGTLDNVLEIISDPYRRRVLFQVLEETQLTEQDIASRLQKTTSRENEDHRAPLVVLRHIHLPKLENNDYIEWDRETGTISKGPNIEAVEPLLRLLRDHRHELPYTNLGLRTNWH